MNEKHFSCAVCLVDFNITVEPGLTVDEVAANAPDSLAWLSDNSFNCPVCGSPLED